MSFFKKNRAVAVPESKSVDTLVWEMGQTIYESGYYSNYHDKRIETRIKELEGAKEQAENQIKYLNDEISGLFTRFYKLMEHLKLNEGFEPK
jgi:predicted nuclease with TOPRIM domain